MFESEKDLLQTYWKLATKINKAIKKVSSIREEFYKTANLYPCFTFNKDEYIPHYKPDRFVIELMTLEEHATQRLERLLYRYKHFKSYLNQLTKDELNTLKRSIFDDSEQLSTLEIATLNEIQEIEESTLWRQGGYYEHEYTDERIEQANKTSELMTDVDSILERLGVL